VKLATVCSEDVLLALSCATVLAFHHHGRAAPTVLRAPLAMVAALEEFPLLHLVEAAQLLRLLAVEVVVSSALLEVVSLPSKFPSKDIVVNDS
jgi:hypothetical protein